MRNNKILQHLFIAFGIGFFVAYVLIIFQPFGTDQFFHPHKNLFLAGYGAIITLSYLFIYIIAEIFLRPNWVLAGVKFWIVEAVQLFIMILMSITISFFYHHWFVGSELSFISYVGFLLLGGSVAIIPITIIIYIRYTVKQRYMRKEMDKEKLGEKYIVISGNNKNENPLEIYPSELAYIMASGNYTDIYKLENGELKRYMLRNSLSNIQTQLPEHHFMKIHRSYIVNMAYFEKVFTKSSNYFLMLSTGDVEIPLSRNVVNIVREICDK